MGHLLDRSGPTLWANFSIMRPRAPIWNLTKLPQSLCCNVCQYLSETSHQFVWYSIPFIQYSVDFQYSPKTNMVWTPFHIDLTSQTHTLEKLNKYYFPYFFGCWRRGGAFWWGTQKYSTDREVHESCADPSECSGGMQQLHMLRLLVIPNLAHHQQYILTLVAWLSFCLQFWWKPVAPHCRAGHESWAQFQ